VAEFPADERHEQGDAEGEHDPHQRLPGAVHAQQEESAGEAEQGESDQHESDAVEPSAVQVGRLLHPEEDHDEAGGDGHRGNPQQLGQRHDVDQLTCREGGHDHAGLQRADQQSRRTPGERGRVAASTGAGEDQGCLQRQPDDVETLQRPRHQEEPEVAGERHRRAGHGGHRGRDQQHPTMTDHVAELGEGGDHDRRSHGLAALQPVHVGVRDAEVAGDVGQQRRVEALDDTAGQLDEHQEADHGTERAEPYLRRVGDRPRAGGAHSGSPFSSAR
jgi:hypothetical protein